MIKKPSPLGRVPPKGAGEVRRNVPFYCSLAANPYCGNTSSVFFIALGGDEKSTFPKGEGIGAPAPVRIAAFLCEKRLSLFFYCISKEIVL